MRLVLVGSGHVFDLAPALHGLIDAERPEVVALELDAERFRGLLDRRAGVGGLPERVRRAPRLYRYLARFQDSVADSFGVQAGDEMLAAADAAQSIGAGLALIDRNAEASIRRALGQMGLGEKARLFWSALQGSLFSRRRAAVEVELRRYHADPDRYLDEMGRQFPTLKRILVDERNAHMAGELRALAAQHARVVAVVGDGHVPGLVRLLSDLKPLVVRLPELRARAAEMGLRWKSSPGVGTVGFSFTGKSLEGALSRE